MNVAARWRKIAFVKTHTCTIAQLTELYYAFLVSCIECAVLPGRRSRDMHWLMQRFEFLSHGPQLINIGSPPIRRIYCPWLTNHVSNTVYGTTIWLIYLLCYVSHIWHYSFDEGSGGCFVWVRRSGLKDMRWREWAERDSWKTTCWCSHLFQSIFA